MYRIYKAVQERMETFLMAESNLTINASTGTNEVTVEDSSLFNYEALNSYYGTVMLKDDDTTGEIGLNGEPEGVEFIKIDNVSGDRIIFQSNLQRSWTTAKNAKIVRAPNEVIVQDVIIGDVRVETSYPAVCVIPVSKQIEWWTLSGTHDAVSIDFIVYSKDTDTEKGVESMLKLTDVVEHILMSNLHINVKDCEYKFEATSRAIVSNIDYATIQKGSEFLQASRLSWKGDMYFWRLFVTAQSVIDPFPTGAERCE